VPREILGDNRSKPYYIQVQLVTFCDLSVFLSYEFEAYSINSSKMMNNFHEVLKFDKFLCKLAVGSPYSLNESLLVDEEEINLEV